ncbi:MAG: hypothetical protein ACRCZG_00040 [Culicoidibacterales bacterium]
MTVKELVERFSSVDFTLYNMATDEETEINQNNDLPNGYVHEIKEKWLMKEFDAGIEKYLVIEYWEE